MYLSDRQCKNKKSEKLKSSREMPQQLAVGLAVHQAVRSKKIVNILNGFGMSCEYNKLVRIESQIENIVLERMQANGGIYLPPDIVKGRHVFFAIDNVDFSEDTPDGKRNLHGTAMAIYQQCQPDDKEPDLILSANAPNTCSIHELPPSLTELLHCPNPPPRPQSTTYPTFNIDTDEQPLLDLSTPDVTLLYGRTTQRSLLANTDGSLQELNVPPWSAYQSMVSSALPVTRVGSPHLIAAPAHEWSTMLTVLKQSQDIKTAVVGPSRKTVITLDLGLYQPAKQLQMSRTDLNNIILRPGELHIVMAQLRTIGSYIENSGIDLIWTEADLYGPSTVKQILEGNHVKRGQTAHVITLQALFNLYQEAFLVKYPDLKPLLEQATSRLDEAFATNKETVTRAHQEMCQSLKSLDIDTKMEIFEQSTTSPLFTCMRQYMQMILDMLLFIRAVRTADWLLHLKALENFTKYFFAHDKLNYARMMPLYLAEMDSLKTTDPDILQEFLQGNWVANKNEEVPFCAIGADHALEHINRVMEVSGGLVGITLNASARTRFFLIAPELARLSSEAQELAGVKPTVPVQHHTMTTAFQSREEKSVAAVTDTLRRFTNPFQEESEDLFNIVTKAVVSEKTKNDLCNHTKIGIKLFNDFVRDRITSGKLGLWSPMKKQRLSTWRKVGKEFKVKAAGKIIERKEDRSLFARMMVVCKSRPEINMKDAIGLHEFLLFQDHYLQRMGLCFTVRIRVS